MLLSVEQYYLMSQNSGIPSMSCPINAHMYDRISKKTKCWPKVKTYRDYIDKCYAIAKKVPMEKFQSEYITQSHNQKALKRLHLEVIDALIYLDKEDLNHNMGYTPICHMREQLLELSAHIEDSIAALTPMVLPPSRKSVIRFSRNPIFAWLLG